MVHYHTCPRKKMGGGGGGKTVGWREDAGDTCTGYTLT